MTSLLVEVTAVVVAIGIFGWIRYRTPLNPLTFFASFDMGLMTLVSMYAVILFWRVSYIDDNAIRVAARMTELYAIAVALPFLFRGRLPAKMFRWLLRIFQLRGAGPRGFSAIRFFTLLSMTSLAFLLLAGLGGGGLLWLTNSRQAYQLYRAGVGPFYILFQWTLTTAFIFLIWTVRPRRIRLLLISVIAVGICFFSGSKLYVATVPAISVIYYNFYIRKIKARTLITLALIFAMGLGSLLMMQGFAESYADVLYYFTDFAFSVYYIGRYDEIGPLYGRAHLTSLWQFVPRRLVPSKPYEYGVLLINAVLFPGAAEVGNTPAMPDWVVGHVDFGVAGVIIFGFLAGLWRRMTFEAFLADRWDFFGFILMIHICFLPIYAYQPLPAVVIWCLLLKAFFRIRWASRSHRPASPSPFPRVSALRVRGA